MQGALLLYVACAAFSMRTMASKRCSFQKLGRWGGWPSSQCQQVAPGQVSTRWSLRHREANLLEYMWLSSPSMGHFSVGWGVEGTQWTGGSMLAFKVLASLGMNNTTPQIGTQDTSALPATGPATNPGFGLG